MERVVGRLDGRTMAPWATSAIDNDELASGQSLHTFTQLLYTDLARSRADVLGTRYMRLLVKNVGPHMDYERLFSLGGLKDLD
jgi:hypothetical protein